jgi:hypothetical protein
MQMYIFTVRDAKANLFGRPFYSVNVGAALRGFTDQVNTPTVEGQQNDLFNHTEDFELYELGTFNDADGSFDLLDRPKPVCTASSVKKTS